MEERPVIRQNSMFRAGKNSDLNACVGNNGFPDIHTYTEGYHDAVVALTESAKKNPYNVDALIYPILFCARHAVELFLKKQIYDLSDIRAITLDQETQSNLLLNHSLNDLWGQFKDLSKVDKRYESYVVALEPYINYFYAVDDTGQTFRYPTDIDEERHLTEYSCINIGIFSEQYEIKHQIIEELVDLTEYLKVEYKQMTFVKGLSRQQINEIACMLPNRDDWGDEEFDRIKTEVLEKYNISSNTFSKALNLIQGHREFAPYIGMELSLGEIDPYQLKYFIDSFNKYRARLETNNFSEICNEYAAEICGTLPKDCIYALSALYNISFFKLYSEQYDADIEKNRAQDDVFWHVFYKLGIGRGSVLDHINKGLEKLGQKTLLNAFD